jgi:hypothetical protein
MSEGWSVKYHIKPSEAPYGIFLDVECEHPPDPSGWGNPDFHGTLLTEGTWPTVVHFPNWLERRFGITLDMKYQKAYKRLRKILDRMEAKDREACAVLQRGEV